MIYVGMIGIRNVKPIDKKEMNHGTKYNVKKTVSFSSVDSSVYRSNQGIFS